MSDPLTEEEAEARVRGVCFTSGPPGRVGVELEWLVHDSEDARRPVAATRRERALASLAVPDGLPSGSRVTREPGGQVELSSRPADLVTCLENLAGDLARLRHELACHGLRLTGLGLEPYRDPPRLLEHPRYRAMEAYFDRGGPWGRMMMRATAGVQVNLDAGDDSDGVTGYRHRWRLAHRIGPVLVAGFANSPLRYGRPTGWRSTRQSVWVRLDPSRTRPPADADDPRGAWAGYALDAHLLCVRRTPPLDWDAPWGVTFRGWLSGAAGGLRPPTRDDLDYHLTTLFPPVRPRGWLELRMIDAQWGDDWTVPPAVAATLLDDPKAAEIAWRATESLCRGGSQVPDEEVWQRAARLGPADPQIGDAVRTCFAAAGTALARAGHTALHQAVADFAERYAERGRCPADDHLDALTRGPVPELLEHTW